MGQCSLPEAEAAIKPDSQKSYLEQGSDMLKGKADVSVVVTTPPLFPRCVTRRTLTPSPPRLLRSPSRKSRGPSRRATRSPVTPTRTSRAC